MALTAPTPPTPPTPPSVPQVTLGGGGTVTESNADGTQTSDLEAQARAAVARGEGALSKTTTDDGADGNGTNGANASNAQGNAQNAQAQQASPQAAQNGNAQQGSTQTVAADGGQANAILGQDADAQAAKEQQALEEGRAHQTQSALGGHGALYIGFSIIAFVVLAVVAFRWLKNRRKEHGALRFGDFADEGGDWRGRASGGTSHDGAQAGGASDDDRNLRGRTAGDILSDIEREEERELAIPRRRAAEYQRQQAREAAARERRRQEREEAAARKEKEALRAKEADRKDRPENHDEDDRPHFDLRA